MKKEGSGSIEVKHAGARALVKQRGDGLWVVRWREAGKGRNTTAATKERALELARAKVRGLASGQGGQLLTAEDAELVARLKRAAGQRSAFTVVAQLEDAVARLGGWEHLQRALHFYEASGMARVEKKLFREAKWRFLGLYEKKSRLGRAGLRKELDNFDTAHPDFVVCDLTEPVLHAWLERGGPGPRYFNNRLATWRTFLNRCRSWNYWPKGEKHPGETISVKEEPKQIKIWTVAQVQAMVDTLPEKRLPYVVIGCWLGLRPFELLRITWEHFDWERGYLHVTPEVALKTMHERFVPLPHNVREMLAPWRGERGRCCQTHDREEISLLLRKAGIISGWSQDVMRHSSISYAIASGKSIGVVAEEHGNSERVIRQRYRRPLRKEDGQAWFAVGLTNKTAPGKLRP